MVKLELVSGLDLRASLEELAALRIEVFREYPYLYDGNADYEAKYLLRYVKSKTSMVVIARDEGAAVGMSSCLAMSEEIPELTSAFENAGYNLESIFYFGESVLLPAYRGQGVGKEFFRLREQHANHIFKGKLKTSCFCAVDRPSDHHLKPANYQPLDGFWQKLGYERHPELKARLGWKEVGAETEADNTLTFWLKNW